MKLRVMAVMICLVMVAGCQKKQTAASDLYNDAAMVDVGLPYPVMQWKPLTTMVDRGAGTTSTLFGNDAAVAAARAGQSYPAGAVLGLVMWRQKDDPHWFGARIPDGPLQVEFVEFGASGMRYREFAGSPMVEQAGAQDRGAVIAAMKAAALP
ncbi:hypothetical protein GOB94_10045 [Granulicella sp. 5B5]|uniref:cytochrome P460 family protein n=1 Tax=Granulicella sp. 5B5 TaxID=1617967 RepID=UPI0015F49465|nr:cytochrome P460 family protein [Granulicella sp. 5B5]QMV18973.1 hypothetical protein GOB94_10045 [Granulicella sp. 5B5]